MAIRLTDFPDIETLLVKVPSMPHEKAHRWLSDEMVILLSQMGVDPDGRKCVGAGRYTAPSLSEKEGDTAYKSALLRPRDTEWPHFVIESGVSESRPRLRQDVGWWMGAREVWSSCFSRREKYHF